jgi:HK97 family phage major capsid protein
LKGSKSAVDVEAKLTRIAEDVAANFAKQQSYEEAINQLSKKMGRPGAGTADELDLERKEAIDFLRARHNLRVPKHDAAHQFNPADDHVTEAVLACKAVRGLMRTTDVNMLPADQRKALSSFALGSSGFILPPELSNRVLSCLVDVSDITGLVSSLPIAGPSVKFMVDNVRLFQAAWACETSCFANNPSANLLDGLGEVEIKPDPLRYVLCVNRDLLEDADMDLEGWMLNKVSWAFRNTVTEAIIRGDGQGKPFGFMTPAAGLPIVETGAGTPAGEFSWQDVVMLKYEVPVQYHAGASYLLNQKTFGQALTISDANGRPILITAPTEDGQYRLTGSPVRIVTQMPDVAPGATPIAFGDWRELYMVVNRKAVTMQQDPYTVGFCILFKWEARVGGSIICPNAARLLRIR